MRRLVACTSILIALLTTPAFAVIDPGTPGDGVTDLLLDQAIGNLTIDTDSLTLSGFVLRSAAAVFTGDPANIAGWWFTEDTDTSISGNMGLTKTGLYDLGNVIGPEFSAGSYNPFVDFTFTYTISGTPGSFYGNLIDVTASNPTIPAPGAILLGSIGIGGVSWLRRRRTL
ncbi:MAG: hypothetical protein ACYS3N_18655 [Planctomycetota bacterium]|jgi:hypothetical protein